MPHDLAPAALAAGNSRFGDHRRKLPALLFWLGMIAAYYGYSRVNGLSSLEVVQRMLGFIANKPIGPLIYILVYAFRPLILFPATLLTMAGGFIFGPVLGLFYTLVASNTSSAIAYYVGRYFGQDLIEDTGSDGLIQGYAQRMRQNSFETVMIMRFIFLPYDAVSYLAGFLRIRFLPFISATALGSIPGTVAFVGFGASIERFDGGLPTIDPATLAISASILVVSIGLSRLFKRRDGILMTPSLLLPIALALLLNACASGDAGAPSASGDFDRDDWASVLEAARGQTVSWHIWGGSEGINRFVDDRYGEALETRFGITLKRVPVADTVDAVNLVLSEKEAGTVAGSVDLIWINGENFVSLKQAESLYAGWASKLPNSRFVDWDNPAIKLDFGEPVDDMESPWSSAQFQLVYDSARMQVAELPRSYAELRSWACEHPGRFTYIAPGPGAFQGTRFVKGALFEISGDPALWSRFDQATWDRWSPELWEFFNAHKSCLWRKGKTYPRDENELHALFANKEVDFSITLAIVGAGALIDQGLVPPTARAFVFDDNMIGDFNYVAIPAMAPHKAASLVLANLILDPELQAEQVLPENGFGLGFGIDVNRVTDEVQKQALDSAMRGLGDAATPAGDLATSLVGDAAAPYQALVEEGWREHVLIGK